MPYLATKEDKSHIPQCNASNYIIKVARTGDLFISNGRAIKECADDRQYFLINDVVLIFLGHRVHFWGHIVWLVFPSAEMFVWNRLLVCPDLFRSGEVVSRKLPRERHFGLQVKAEIFFFGEREKRSPDASRVICSPVLEASVNGVLVSDFTGNSSCSEVG